MDRNINIVHDSPSFSSRSGYWILVLIGILFAFFLAFYLDESENIVISMSIIALVFGSLFAYKVWQNKLYLVDLESDSKRVKGRYFNGKNEHQFDAPLNEIEIKLKNTSSRSGFNCELLLVIGNNKFTVEDTFDWTLSEMKQLFEYIKYHKKETLMHEDKFNLSMIEKKVNKLTTTTATRQP